MIANPLYVGKWHPQIIPNPAYIGPWKARQIPNPDYWEDPHPAHFMPIVVFTFSPSNILGSNWY